MTKKETIEIRNFLDEKISLPYILLIGLPGTSETSVISNLAGGKIVEVFTSIGQAISNTGNPQNN